MEQQYSLARPVSGRGFGRTYRALNALPDGGVFVVHSDAFLWYVRVLLEQQGRRTNAVRAVPVRDLDQLRGLSVPVAVDHFVEESAPLEVLAELSLLADLANRRAREHFLATA